MVLPVLSFTESQALAALRTFLLDIVADGTEVVRGQVNRVAEPRGADFIVMWPIRQERLETNETSYADNDVVGSIAGTILTVTAIGHGAISPGVLLVDESELIAVDTTIIEQLSGSVGGTGTYRITPSQTVGSGVIYAGERRDLVATQWTVQIDVHGPASGNNARVIETLFRSDYGVTALEESGLTIAPLYCESPRELPFENAEQQTEYRWVIEAVMQISPIVSSPQRFADELDITTIEVDTTYPP